MHNHYSTGQVRAFQNQCWRNIYICWILLTERPDFMSNQEALLTCSWKGRQRKQLACHLHFVVISPKRSETEPGAASKSNEIITDNIIHICIIYIDIYIYIFVCFSLPMMSDVLRLAAVLFWNLGQSTCLLIDTYINISNDLEAKKYINIPSALAYPPCLLIDTSWNL